MQHQGFTLLELSIVLVIIGLIVGGITAGSSLIRNAELNSIARDVGAYRAAVNSFFYKYNGLPGDLRDAGSYWTACTTVGSNTCSGDGDGTLDYTESNRFWQHLALAGMVQSTTANPTYTSMTAGDGAMASKVSSAVFTASGPYYGWQSAPYNRVFCLQSTDAGDICEGYTTVVTSEMKAIDQKTDDGRAHSGAMLGSVCTGSSLSFSEISSDESELEDYWLPTEFGCGAMFTF